MKIKIKIIIPWETHWTEESGLISPLGGRGSDEQPGGALNSFICVQCLIRTPFIFFLI